MDSFISPFRANIPWLALKLLAAAVVAIIISFGYTYYLNPEVEFWKSAISIKRNWAHKLTKEYGSKVVIYGGSSCAFSIDGQHLLEQHRIPTVNMGLHAGLKPTVLTNWALSETLPNDTLIVAIEPTLLTSPLDSPSFAVQLSYAMHSPVWLDGAWMEHPASRISSLLSVRPSGCHIFTVANKAIRGLPLYGYDSSDIHPSGWMTTNRRTSNVKTKDLPGPCLSREGENLLRWLRDWSTSHHVRLAYSLPWMYVSPRDIADSKRCNLAFLLQVSQFMPILKDRSLGVCSSAEYFADTNYHLTCQAAALRTDSLAQELKTWDVWTVDELKNYSFRPPQSKIASPH